MSRPAEWILGERRVPAPGAWRRFDSQAGELNFSVLVIGAGATLFVDNAFAELGGRRLDGSDPRVSTGPKPATLAYAPLKLSEIQGLTTRFHLYALGPVQSEKLREAMPVCDGVVIAETVPGDSDFAVREAAMCLRGRKHPPVAVIGKDGLASRWKEATDQVVVFSGVPGVDSRQLALKTLLKAALEDLKRG